MKGLENEREPSKKPLKGLEKDRKPLKRSFQSFKMDGKPVASTWNIEAYALKAPKFSKHAPCKSDPWAP